MVTIIVILSSTTTIFIEPNADSRVVFFCREEAHGGGTGGGEGKGRDSWGIGRVSCTFLKRKEERGEEECGGLVVTLFLCLRVFVCLCMCSRTFVLVARRRHGVVSQELFFGVG